MLSDIPSRVITTPGRYAVMLNANAKRWTGELHQDILRWVPKKDLYLTDDFNQAERTVDRLIREGYQSIFTGGGDGTIVYLINAIESRVRAGVVSREDAPFVGVLRMGTGNAIASYLECQPIVDDLRALSSGAPIVVYSVDMIETGDSSYPFAGFGLDALIVNDYDALKEAVQSTALENYVTGLGGYFAAIMTRSAPTAIRTPNVDTIFTNLEGEAHRVDAKGDILETYGPGDILFEGPAKVMGVGSIPNWGFNIRMFPHATRQAGRYQLRIYDGSVAWILANIPRFWKGHLQPGHHFDFLCSHVSCEILGDALPYQEAGDAKGYEKLVEWHARPHPAMLAVPMR